MRSTVVFGIGAQHMMAVVGFLQDAGQLAGQAAVQAPAEDPRNAAVGAQPQ